MIFLCGSGRLGNQIFQFLYCEHLRKAGEKVFSVKMGYFFGKTNKNRFYRNTDSQPFFTFYDVVLRRLFLLLAGLRIISMHNEIHGRLTVKKGLLPFTWINGYFQSDSYYGEDFLKRLLDGKLFTWREEERAAAERFVAENTPHGFAPCFVHVRHGDYPEEWLLTESYYKKALEQLSSGKKLHFFLLGDDPDWCRAFFADVPSKTISQNSAMTDFLIMTLCEGGVISNSTFAWWGAYLCRRTLPVIAPEYWLGGKNKEWYPPLIRTDKFVWII